MSLDRTLAAIGMWMLLGCGPLAAQRFTLSGTVVDGDNRPMAGVAVTLQTQKWEPVGGVAISDPQGRFAFGGLAAGEYILSAEGSGFGTVRYGESADPGWFSTVKVGGERGDKTVTFRIVPRGLVDGVVRDEFGEPMMSVGVALVHSSWQSGRTAVRMVATKTTDDRGRYRFGNLAPGEYSACVNSGQNPQAPAPGPVDFAAQAPSRAYTRNCGRAFRLAPGGHVQADLSPLIGTASTVSGRVVNRPPQAGLVVFLASEGDGVNQSLGGAVDGSGVFMISNVPAGRYRLWASASTSQGNLTASLPLDVGGTDVSGIELALGSGATVDVTLQGLSDNPTGPVGVMLRSVDGSFSPGGARSKDGAFHIAGVAAARYRLIASLPPDSCLESVKLGDREIRGAAFEVSSGAALEVSATVSKNCGTIEARAMRGGDPVPGAKVVLLKSGTPQEPGEIAEDVADDDGEYSFKGLTPGHYLLWAWAMEGPGAMTGPASLAAVDGAATAIDVAAGAPVHADVPVLQDGGKGQ